MKIIGTGKGDSWILEATKDEVAHLLGYDSDYYLRDRTNGQLSPGNTLKIHEAWTLITKMRRQAEALKGAAGTLKAVAAALGEAPELIHGILDTTSGDKSA